MLNKGWTINKIKPPEETLIQFIVLVGGNYGEYWGQYEDGIYKGHVSSEMPFPKDFKEDKIYAWKKTDMSVKKGKLAYKVYRRTRI